MSSTPATRTRSAGSTRRTRMGAQMFSTGTRWTVREALTGIGDQVGTTSLAISVKLSRTVNRRRAPASAGTTSPAGTWSPFSHGARGGTTSTSCRRRSSAISTEHSSKLLCTSSLTFKASRHHRAAFVIHSWEMVPPRPKCSTGYTSFDQNAALVTLSINWRTGKGKAQGEEAVAGLRRPSPEDRALLGNGERQGERGFPLGRARGPAATEKRGEGDPIPVGAFSPRQFSSKLERQPKDSEVHLN